MPTNDQSKKNILRDEPSGLPAGQSAAQPSGGEGRRSGLAGSLWFAVKAIEIRLRFIAILVAIGLVIGYWDTIQNYWDKWTRPAADGGVLLSADDEFYCPMHPSVVRDQPDSGGATPKCPICGMPLSKRKKGQPAQLPEGVISRVQLSPYRVELAGIKTVEAVQRPLTLEVRTVGYVVIDERRLWRIVLRAAGFVEKLYVNESFSEVRQGDPLAEVYSPELYSAAQELLVSRRGATSQLADMAMEKLRLLGVAQQEIDEILRTGVASSRLIIRSPHSGHVFAKRVVEGDHVDAGQMLFEIADLSTVWIEGEAYERDAAMIQRGQIVEAMIDAFPGRHFQGRVGLVHPHMETATRTVRVRFELDNPGHLLRPGMFATVSLKTPVLETEPFRSQLMAANGETETAKQNVCPVTGAQLGSMGQPVHATAEGRSVLLCCAGCQDKFAARPDYYLKRLSVVSTDGVLAVPERAIIDTGSTKVAYIEREPGLFEGVAVTLGPLCEGYYPVMAGLLPGDRVAAAGAFLVDAETRLNPAAAATYFGASGTPSSGGSAPAPAATRADGGDARDSSPQPSDKHRANLAQLPEADRKLAEQQAVCPISGLPLGSMGIPQKMTVQGRVLFVCCEGCRDQVNQDPQAALSRLGDANEK